MRFGVDYRRLSGAGWTLSGLLLLILVVACTPRIARDPGAREQALAENDVWHAAKLRGVAFRAIGQEPGWLLEITNGEAILVVTDYGQKSQKFPYVDPQENPVARQTVYQLDAGHSVLIEGKPCMDSMSGATFEVTVTLILGNKSYSGCGRALF